MRRGLALLGIGFLYTLAALAQDNAELLARMKAMEERIKTLEAEVQQLRTQQAAAEAPGTPGPAPVPVPSAEAAALPGAAPGGPLPYYGGSQAAASKIFNPDISVIGDFLGAAGNGGGRPTAALEMHESEIGLQAIIDPYARADFFLSFGESGVELEEGYLTFPALAGGLQLRAGKMRAAFGKVNTLHNHVLPWIDRPLVTQNLTGGEEGISDAGLSLSRILPAPGGLFLEGTAQVFRGDSEGVFRSFRRSDVSTIGHLRAYRDLSESTNVDLGFSYARGHSPDGQPLINQLYGFDATVRWKPLRRSIYRSFLGRTELIWSRADMLSGRQTPFGYYVSGDYQFGRRWLIGGRFDRSERFASALLHDTGGSLLLTYRPSEFSQIRGQLRRTRYAEAMTANEILFQFLFSIGAHGAHPF
jgi:hypothetical protein